MSTCSSDPNIDHLNIDKSPRLHARVISEVLAIAGGHRIAAPSGPKATPASAPAGQDGGTPRRRLPAMASSLTRRLLRHPPSHRRRQLPAKPAMARDPGKASPVADGTPLIALPERGSARQNAETPVSPPHKPAASAPALRAEQVPQLIFFAGFLITDRLIVSFDCQHSLARKRVTLASGPALQSAHNCCVLASGNLVRVVDR